jgi:hypothetical protein
MGTPSYMSPEQARGKAKELGPSTDIYALGAILYELLTGRPPFKAATPLYTILQVVDDEPVPPTQLQRRIPRDLETICLKCLEKDPIKRYHSAQALSEDLHRWLADEPILGRRTSRWERTQKWMRRHPAASALLAVTGASAASLMLLAGFLWYNAEMRAEAVQDLGRARGALAAARTERQTALENVQQLAKKAAAERVKLDKLQHLAEVEKAKAKTARVEASHILFAADMQFAHAAWKTGEMQRLYRLLENHRPAVGQDDLRGFEWHYLWRLSHEECFSFAHQAPRSGLAKNVPHSVHLAVAPDGTMCASVGADQKIRIWHLESGQLLKTLEGPAQPAVSLAYTHQGKKLQALTVDNPKVKEDAVENLKDILTRKEPPPSLDHLNTNLSVLTIDIESPEKRQVERFAPARLVTPASLVLAEQVTERGMVFLKGQRVICPIALALAPDGKTLAIAGIIDMPRAVPASSQEGGVLLWDLGKNEERELRKAHQGPIMAAAFAPDGTLASASSDGTIKLWNPNGKEHRTLTGHRAPVSALFFPRTASASFQDRWTG